MCGLHFEYSDCGLQKEEVEETQGIFSKRWIEMPQYDMTTTPIH
jgi:hypothetical protein